MIDFCFLLTTITLTLSKVSLLLLDHYLRNNDFSYYEQIASHTHPSDLQLNKTTPYDIHLSISKAYNIQNNLILKLIILLFWVAMSTCTCYLIKYTTTFQTLSILKEYVLEYLTSIINANTLLCA